MAVANFAEEVEVAFTAGSVAISVAGANRCTLEIKVVIRMVAASNAAEATSNILICVPR